MGGGSGSIRLKCVGEGEGRLLEEGANKRKYRTSNIVAASPKFSRRSTPKAPFSLEPDKLQVHSFLASTGAVFLSSLANAVERRLQTVQVALKFQLTLRRENKRKITRGIIKYYI